MRALVDSPEVRDLFPDELRDLKEGIGAWKPITKALKEIKKRVGPCGSAQQVEEAHVQLEPMAGKQSRLRVESSSGLNEMGKDGSKIGPTGKLRSHL